MKTVPITKLGNNSPNKIKTVLNLKFQRDIDIVSFNNCSQFPIRKKNCSHFQSHETVHKLQISKLQGIRKHSRKTNYSKPYKTNPLMSIKNTHL